MGRLTTHVLDTAQGCPGQNIAVQLFVVGDQRTLLTTAVTNADGRTDVALLSEEKFHLGCYEIVFSIGDYFSTTPLTTTEPAFLDEVVIRFSISQDTHYHVPLLVSPWAYSTYRGS